MCQRRQSFSPSWRVALAVQLIATVAAHLQLWLPEKCASPSQAANIQEQETQNYYHSGVKTQKSPWRPHHLSKAISKGINPANTMRNAEDATSTLADPPHPWRLPQISMTVQTPGSSNQGCRPQMQKGGHAGHQNDPPEREEGFSELGTTPWRGRRYLTSISTTLRTSTVKQSSFKVFYLLSHPVVGLCGSSFHLSGTRRERRHPGSHPPLEMASYPCRSAPAQWAPLAWQAHPRAGSRSSAGSRWPESCRSPRGPRRGRQRLVSGRGRSVRGAGPQNGCPARSGGAAFHPQIQAQISKTAGFAQEKLYHPNSPG